MEDTAGRRGAALAFGIALMAWGLSSSGVGQIVMAGFMNWLCRVQIADHHCTNRAAQAPRHTGRQAIVPETPEQRVLTVSADLGTLFGKILCAHRAARLQRPLRRPLTVHIYPASQLDRGARSSRSCTSAGTYTAQLQGLESGTCIPAPAPLGAYHRAGSYSP